MDHKAPLVLVLQVVRVVVTRDLTLVRLTQAQQGKAITVVQGLLVVLRTTPEAEAVEQEQ